MAMKVRQKVGIYYKGELIWMGLVKDRNEAWATFLGLENIKHVPQLREDGWDAHTLTVYHSKG